MTAAKALLRPQQDSGHGTTAAAARLWPWQDCVHGKMPWLQPKQDCGHDKTVAMARLRPWQDCIHGMTVATCQDHVQLRTLIRLLRSHRSTVAQLRTSAHYSGPGRAHTLPLSATLCIRPNPVVSTLPHLPCCTVSSPCSVCIFYLVVFSPDLTYFHRT